MKINGGNIALNSTVYKGQQFGQRLVICDTCNEHDWLNIGLKIPSRTDKYKLTKCLNCGAILPCELGNLKKQPPKRCVFCSNIGNHSNVHTKTNTWTLYDDYVVCNILYKNEIISTYIDVEYYDIISSYVWRISKKKQKYYVVSGSIKKGTMVYMHQMVYGEIPNGFEIDHIDGNSLNNRRNNLRIVTHQENVDNVRATRIDNQIGIRGIVYDKRSKTYRTDFIYHTKRYYTKQWKNIEQAVWCRYCFEKYFNLHMINNNPLAEQYLILDNDEKESIKQYVHEIINTQK